MHHLPVALLLVFACTGSRYLQNCPFVFNQRTILYLCAGPVWYRLLKKGEYLKALVMTCFGLALSTVEDLTSAVCSFNWAE